ncbi:MAG: flagellar hook capping FlgD N-terminal domain-containing protein [Myxococcota bacterium]
MELSGANQLAAPRATEVPDTEESSDLGTEAFMQLLVAQLQNQDPLDPMDSREMITQLSELTGVEKLNGIEHRLTALEIASAGIANTQVASLVGKTVTADASSLRLEDAGSVSTVFRLEGRADSITATIRDEAGRTVRTIEMPGEFPGEHVLEWDGMNDTGERLPPGRYSVEFRAVDEAGAPVTASTELTGMVGGVSYENGYPELMVGEARLLLGDVTAIEQ